MEGNTLCHLVDFATWVYVLVILVSVYGAGLFSWWWKVNGEASSVFKYMTLLFVGVFIDNATVLYSRFLWVDGGFEEWHMLAASPFFPMRKLVLLGALLFIVVHMSWRAFHKATSNGRREGD